MSYQDSTPTDVPPPPPAYGPPPYAPRPGSGKDGVAVAALVVGIVSLVSICGSFVPIVFYCFVPLAFLTAVVGIILGFVGLGAPEKASLARIGLIISGASLLLQICVFIFMVVVLGGSIFMMEDPLFWENLIRELEGF
jgi:hypothetical protein